MKVIPQIGRTNDLLAIGELLIDFAPAGLNDCGYPIISAYPGGAPANFLVAAGRLGLKAAFAGAVGNDRFGRLLAKTLSDYDIDIQNLQVTDQAFTTMAMVTLDETGDREFSFVKKPGADEFFELTPQVKEQIKNSRLLHFGSFSLASATGSEAVTTALKLARTAGTWINFDPNYRAPIWSDEDRARQAILTGLDFADSLKIGLDELIFIYPGSGPAQADELNPDHPLVKQLFADRPLQLAMITLGVEGALLIARNGETGDFARGFAPGTPSPKTVDTTGAGDIFGGTAIGIILQLAKKTTSAFTPGLLTGEELTAIGRQANLTASLSTERHGGITSVPDPKEVEAAMQAAGC